MVRVYFCTLALGKILFVCLSELISMLVSRIKYQSSVDILGSECYSSLLLISRWYLVRSALAELIYRGKLGVGD